MFHRTKTGTPINLQAEYALAVTASETATFSTTGQLFIGTTGTITVVTSGGSVATFTGVPSGTVLPVLVTKLLSATATNIILLS